MSASMEGLPPSFFVPEGDAFRATVATRGPWSNEHQHGGPSAALLARAIERHADPSTLRVARCTIVFHRPLAIDLFRVNVETTREGKKVRTVRATLMSADGKIAATADAQIIRRADVGPIEVIDEGLPLPDACSPHTFAFFNSPIGYHVAMEGRHIRGEFGVGKMAIWMRTRVTIVPDEVPSPLQRVVVAADSGNGVSIGLDLAKYTFVNPDLTVALSRELVGEWVGLDARTTFGSDGIGLADTRLLDAKGVVGRGLQTLIVERR